MEDYAGRILAERYRLPLPPSDAYELIETRAFDTRSGQEVLVRQVPLPEVVDAELLDGTRGGPPPVTGGRRVQHGELPAVRRAIEAAQAAASVPDHPRLDQVFDVFAEGGSLWIVSELVPARPLAALIADEPLSPYRAAEVAADVLTALRVLHAHGWTHRNITMRTVLICEDGRVVLTGLAAGAAEDALCGYDPVPPQDGTDDPSAGPWPWPGGEPGGGGGFAAGRVDSGAGHGDGHHGRAALAGPEAGAGYDGASPGGSWNGPSADAGYGEGPGTGLVGGQPGGRYEDTYGGGPGERSGRDDGGTGAGTAVQRGGNAAEYAPLVAPGYDTGPRYRDHISPGPASGPDGSGTAATPGHPGPPSTHGASGSQGTYGPSGTPGTPGTSGALAVPGAYGVSGGSGAPAESGAYEVSGGPGAPVGPGAHGTPGVAGASGALAPTGSPGTPGTSGKPGTPGTPGGSGTPGAAGDRPDLKAAARAGAIAAYRAGAQAAARITEQRKAGSGAEPAPEPGAEPRPEGSKLPQGYSYPYGGPDSGASWHGATPRRQALPPAEAEPPARAALPAQLALPQGYHQADTPDGDAPRVAPDGQAPGQPAPGSGHPDQDRAGSGRPVAQDGAAYGGQFQLGPGRADPAVPEQGGPQPGRQNPAGYAAPPATAGYGQSGPQGGAGHPAAPGPQGPGQAGSQGEGPSPAGYEARTSAGGYGQPGSQPGAGHPGAPGSAGYGQGGPHSGPQGGAGYATAPGPHGPGQAGSQGEGSSPAGYEASTNAGGYGQPGPQPGAAAHPAAPGSAGYGQGGPQSGPHGGSGYPAAPGARGSGQVVRQTGPHGGPHGGAGYATAPGPHGPGQAGLQGEGASPAGYEARTSAGGSGYPAAAGIRGAGQTDPSAGPQGAGPGRAGYGTPPAAGGWGSGPRSGLDAERARQTRMAVVGAVTERWAPEQAQAVHGPWQLAAPVGPATDLWGLGALLYRAVQGHAPYPEDSVAELVEMVCAEPPAFAEECGPLRPIVESLLRQDPTERPDFEELRGWLRSLVRSAPEPDGGFAMLPPVVEDPARLPVTRRRADLHGRHRGAEHPRKPRKPRSLGRSLLLGILVLLSGAVAYALFLMPGSADPQGGQKAAGMKPPATAPSQNPANPTPKPSPKPSGSAQAPSPSANPPESKPAPQPGVTAPSGYTTQQDAEHFSIDVPNGWERRGMNESGQVRYTEGDFVLTVVPGRDKVQGNPDPATYQKDKEPELAPYRSSTWSSVSDIKSTKVGNQLRVTGRYTWIDGNGRSVVARNFVVALGGTYHVVMVTGPQDQEGKVTETFEQATASYRSGG